MKKVCLAVLLLWAVSAFAECDKVVADDAGVMGAGVAGVEQSAQQLINLGVDVRIRTVLGGALMDQREHQYEISCSSWQSPSGGRKSTLLVLMVAPNEHKMGVYYGSAWHKALDDHWNRIKQESMAPRFHDYDWAGGFIAADNQFAARIKASQSEALTPTTHTTINQEQATDFSGLWTFMKWLLGLSFLFLLGYAAYKMMTKSNQQKADEKDAQHWAINEREDAMNRATAAGGPALEAYSRLAGMIKNDPTTDGLTADEYRLIGQAFQRVALPVSDLGWRKSPMNPINQAAKPKKQETHKAAPVEEESVPVRETIPVPPTVVRETVVERGNSGVGDFALGALVGSELSHRDQDEERESRYDREESSSRRDRDDDSSSRSKSDDGDGGSSDWRSSDSDSGGSSDFSSGDGGGGGSSDF